MILVNILYCVFIWLLFGYLVTRIFVQWFLAKDGMRWDYNKEVPSGLGMLALNVFWVLPLIIMLGWLVVAGIRNLGDLMGDTDKIKKFYGVSDEEL